MSDPRTFLIDSEQDIDCESCAWTNTDVTVWDDIRDGTWSYEFECTSCGHLNKDHGTSLDRGAATVFVSLFTLGLLLVLAPLIHLFYVPGTLGHVYLVLTGAMLLAGLTLLAVLTWLHQKGIS